MLGRQCALPQQVSRAAELGWCLHPLKPHDKTPLLTEWPARATSELQQLIRWQADYPDCNWGIVTGAKSGLLVVDLDGEDGLNWLKARVDDGEALPESWAVRTGRGLHLYFALPRNVAIRTSTGKVATGVDIRAERGYVVAPPSLHPSGKRYEVVDESCPLSPPPEWLLRTIQAEPTVLVRKPVQPIRFDALPEGKRNDGLTRYGGALRRRGSTPTEIEDLLLKANHRRCIPPLADFEVRQIAASVSRYEVGGPDPLQTAWQGVQAQTYSSRYEQFLALAQYLQASRPGLDIALPLKRIADHFGVHFTAVQQWRKKAVATGVLISTRQYRAHRKAGLYRLASNSN